MRRRRSRRQQRHLGHDQMVPFTMEGVKSEFSSLLMSLAHASLVHLVLVVSVRIGEAPGERLPTGEE